MGTSKQEEEVLQRYLDNVVDILGKSNPTLSATLIQPLTFATLRRLNANLQGILIGFLVDNGFLISGRNIVSLEGANLVAVELTGFKLFFSNIGPIVLSNVNMSKAHLQDTILLNADLSGSNLSGANLSRAEMLGANLFQVDLSSAILARTKLGGASLQDANLTNADLTEADLGNAGLGGTNLTNATFYRAILAGANLTAANLSNADLTRSNLKDATVTQAQLDQAASLLGATMPDGSIHP
jgi:uncharacterized protein YjbI with pentapeptide repeats